MLKDLRNHNNGTIAVLARNLDEIVSNLEIKIIEVGIVMVNPTIITIVPASTFDMTKFVNELTKYGMGVSFTYTDPYEFQALWERPLVNTVALNIYFENLST